MNFSFQQLSAKQKKTALIALGVVALLLVVFLVIRKIKKASAAKRLAETAPETEANGNAAAPAKVAPVKPLTNDNFPLKLGSRGKRVEQLQQYLIKKKGATLSKHGADGVFGPETQEAVTKFLNVEVVSESHFNHLRMTDFKTFKYA